MQDAPFPEGEDPDAPDAPQNRFENFGDALLVCFRLSLGGARKALLSCPRTVRRLNVACPGQPSCEKMGCSHSARPPLPLRLCHSPPTDFEFDDFTYFKAEENVMLALWLSFLFVGAVLMLNLLIAQLSNVYSIITGNVEAEYLLSRATIIFNTQDQLMTQDPDGVTGRGRIEHLNLNMATVTTEEADYNRRENAESKKSEVCRAALRSDVSRLRSHPGSALFASQAAASLHAREP